VQLYQLFKQGKLEEASAAQIKLAEVEWGFAKGGINGTKWVVAKYLGYPEASSHCRRPYPKYADSGKQSWITEIVKPLEKVEASLKV
jgi:4-hydroxy-2-oxoglutarate aldolase